jgi:hypothetical protein
MQPDFPGLTIDLLAFAKDDVIFQVHDPVFAERRDAAAGFRVQRDESIAGRDVEDAFLPPVGPVRHATSGQLAR